MHRRTCACYISRLEAQLRVASKFVRPLMADPRHSAAAAELRATLAPLHAGPRLLLPAAAEAERANGAESMAELSNLSAADLADELPSPSRGLKRKAASDVDESSPQRADDEE